ncbi:hypothetical protein [Sanguibacter massiliensis]|uniref:hypothetical protein n=1 Tax=Sanguibacter massiliensis TaxID=1973217 RepID=UPI00101AE058|nr:hypothetical protein [Sanguibacter massiliensis]
MTDTAPPAPPPIPAPHGDELAWVAARLAHVSGVLTDARATLVQVRTTTWRSGAALRFLELVGLLADDLEVASGLVAEAERALPRLGSAAVRAEQAVSAAGAQA